MGCGSSSVRSTTTLVKRCPYTAKELPSQLLHNPHHNADNDCCDPTAILSLQSDKIVVSPWVPDAPVSANSSMQAAEPRPQRFRSATLRTVVGTSTRKNSSHLLLVHTEFPSLSLPCFDSLYRNENAA